MELVVIVLIFATVVVKALTSKMISRMKHQIKHVAHIKKESLKQLKFTQDQHAVFEQSKMVLTGKKTKTIKQLNRLKKEMASFSNEEEARKEITTIRKADS